MNETDDLVALIRSRVALVVIESREELRVLDLLKRAASLVKLSLYSWNVAEGLRMVAEGSQQEDVLTEPAEILRHIWNMKIPGIFVLLDFHPYLADPRNVRLIKEIVHSAERYHQTVVFLSHRVDVPEELRPLTARFELHLPDPATVTRIVNDVVKKWPLENAGRQVSVDPEALRLLIKNFTGLAVSEIERLTRKAVADQALTLEDIPEVARAKYDLLNKDGVIFYEHDTARFSDVGGLQKLKKWLQQRAAIFLGEQSTPSADMPKGILLLGIQGSGKSLAAKAVAGTWQIPLLRLDFGALYDKYYGETERKTRESLRMAEAMAPCVLWLDEVEKGVATGDSDGGTSRRVLGTLLTWMAERKCAVFIVATCNDIQSLPPELLRKGRLDEVFFVDLPDFDTRREILAIHLKKRGLDPANFDLDMLSKACEGFSGAEIEQAVVSGLYSTVGGVGKLDNGLLLGEIRSTRPLSVVMAEQIEAMRQWAADRTVPAG